MMVYILAICFFVSLDAVFNQGAGILPYAYKNGEPYFLLGRESAGRSKGSWADCGGGALARDGGNVFETAYREFCEEIGYNPKKHLYVKRQLYTAPYIEIKKPTWGYRMYFAKIHYKPAHQFHGDGEKNKFAWIPAKPFLLFMGNAVAHTKKIPTVFNYQGKNYRLRGALRLLFEQGLQQYDPAQAAYYFTTNKVEQILRAIL